MLQKYLFGSFQLTAVLVTHDSITTGNERGILERLTYSKARGEVQNLRETRDYIKDITTLAQVHFVKSVIHVLYRVKSFFESGLYINSAK